MERIAFAIVASSCVAFGIYHELQEIQFVGYRFTLKCRYEPTLKVVLETVFLWLVFIATFLLAKVDEVSACIVATGGMTVIGCLMGDRAIRTRTKLKFTPRATRIFAISVAFGIVCVGLAVWMHRACTAIFTAVLVACCGRMFAWLGFAVMYPIDSYRNKKYIRLAQNKFASADGIKIGITGSFGKTSCKNILKEMLSLRYNVFCTQGNFNTPLGLAKSAERLNGDEDFLIAEMGARYMGDIKELCKIFAPSVGIVTGVTAQHLQTFGNLHNVYLTKKELPDSLPVNGLAFFNGDNENSAEMFEETYFAEKILVGGRLKSGIHAENIKISSLGCEFDIVGLDAPCHCVTKLLGRHNVANIVVCAAVANKFGITSEEIAGVVKELVPIPHRLELIKGYNGVKIIDDSYNSNIDGAISALEVLGEFEGRKVVYEQGLVELGARSKEVNIALGERLADIADVVILSGKNERYIKIGLNNKGFPSASIHSFASFAEAQCSLGKILEAGDVFLIQNDLP